MSKYILVIFENRGTNRDFGPHKGIPIWALNPDQSNHVQKILRPLTDRGPWNNPNSTPPPPPLMAPLFENIYIIAYCIQLNVYIIQYIVKYYFGIFRYYI